MTLCTGGAEEQRVPPPPTMMGEPMDAEDVPDRATDGMDADAGSACAVDCGGSPSATGASPATIGKAEHDGFNHEYGQNGVEEVNYSGMTSPSSAAMEVPAGQESVGEGVAPEAAEGGFCLRGSWARGS